MRRAKRGKGLWPKANWPARRSPVATGGKSPSPHQLFDSSDELWDLKPNFADRIGRKRAMPDRNLAGPQPGYAGRRTKSPSPHHSASPYNCFTGVGLRRNYSLCGDRSYEAIPEYCGFNGEVDPLSAPYWPELSWPHRLARPRTLGSQPKDRGSNPRGATSRKATIVFYGGFRAG